MEVLKCLCLMYSFFPPPPNTHTLLSFPYCHTTTRICGKVKVVKVVPPSSSPPKSLSPIKLPVIHGQLDLADQQLEIQSYHTPSVSKSPTEKLTNGISSKVSEDTDTSPSILKSASDGVLVSSQVSKAPVSTSTKLEPTQYEYVVEDEGVVNPEQKTVKASSLSRPKGLATPKKLRLFMRNSTYRSNEKQIFVVKVITCIIS